MTKSDAALALTSEQVMMVEENHNLIFGFMHKYKLCEDMYSVIGIELCRAAATFDESKGVSFSSYAYVCMLNECRKVWQVEKKRQTLNLISTEELLGDAENFRIEDSMRSKDSIAGVETADFFAWFIEDASTKDLLIILRLIQGHSQVEIAKEMGYTKSYVGARLKSIRERYRNGDRLLCKRTAGTEQGQSLKQEILHAIQFDFG